MKTTFTHKGRNSILLTIAFLLAFNEAVAQIRMSSLVNTYTQDFNTLPATGTQAEIGINAFIPDGWTVQRSVPDNVMYVNNGSSNTGGLYSYGHTNSTDRAIGAIAAAKPGEFTYNLLLQNTSEQPVIKFTVAYIAEQWRCGSINTDVQSLTFSYAIAADPASFDLSTKANAKGWTNVPSMQFKSPVIRRTAGHVNGDDPANRALLTYTLPEAIPAGHYVMLRWRDADELEQDHGLAIDDVKVTWEYEQTIIPLPVELTKFTAKLRGKAVELAWTTASEQNSRHFEIERSANGKQFHTLGIIQAQGTTSLTTNYSYTDTEPLIGIAYYRLKQVDDDVTYTYSRVLAVNVKQTTAASLYPTMAYKELKLEVPQATAGYYAIVYDKLGKSVLEQHLSGSPVYTFDVNLLGHGNYVLVLLDELGQRQVMRFVKK